MGDWKPLDYWPIALGLLIIIITGLYANICITLFIMGFFVWLYFWKEDKTPIKTVRKEYIGQAKSFSKEAHKSGRQGMKSASNRDYEQKSAGRYGPVKGSSTQSTKKRK